jgi:hypothetical protein
VGAECLYAGGQPDRDRQTDMMKLIAAFCNFAKAPKKKEENLENETGKVL